MRTQFLIVGLLSITLVASTGRTTTASNVLTAGEANTIIGGCCTDECETWQCPFGADIYCDGKICTMQGNCVNTPTIIHETVSRVKPNGYGDKRATGQHNCGTRITCYCMDDGMGHLQCQTQSALYGPETQYIGCGGCPPP